MVLVLLLFLTSRSPQAVSIPDIYVSNHWEHDRVSGSEIQIRSTADAFSCGQFEYVSGVFRVPPLRINCSWAIALAMRSRRTSRADPLVPHAVSGSSGVGVEDGQVNG